MKEIQKELFDKNEKAIKKVNEFIDSIDWKKFESQKFVKPKPLTKEGFYNGLVFVDFDANHVLKHNPQSFIHKPCHTLTIELLWYKKFKDGKKNGPPGTT